MRHPLDLGGVYYCLNAIMNMISVLVSAVLYSLYVPVATVGCVIATAGVNGTERNGTLAGSDFSASLAIRNHYVANVANACLSSGKIDDRPLFVSVAALLVVWLISALGLRLTIKRKYVRTFVSTQSGCDYTCNFFLNHEGDDAARIYLFFFNERKWRSIRDRVRQWVLNAYAVWEQLRPTWFDESLQARIPDDFMPAHLLAQLNAQTPSGRRRTLDATGLLRRMTLAAGSNINTSEAASSSDSAAAINVPSCKAAAPEHLYSTTSPAILSALNIEVGAPILGSVSRRSSSTDAPVDDEYETMPEEAPEEIASADGAHVVPSQIRHDRIESTAGSRPQNLARLQVGAGLDSSVRVFDLEAESEP
jgi:hypothetical protein